MNGVCERGPRGSSDPGWTQPAYTSAMHASIPNWLRLGMASHHPAGGATGTIARQRRAPRGALPNRSTAALGCSNSRRRSRFPMGCPLCSRPGFPSAAATKECISTDVHMLTKCGNSASGICENLCESVDGTLLLKSSQRAKILTDCGSRNLFEPDLPRPSCYRILTPCRRSAHRARRLRCSLTSEYPAIHRQASHHPSPNRPSA